MTERTADDLEVSRLVESLNRIRDETARLRRSVNELAHEPRPGPFSPPTLAPLPQSGSPAEAKEMPSLRNLLQLQHVAFVSAAYTAILGRPADPEGLQHILQWLASGGSKIAVLDGLRYSDEGRLRKTRLRGLRWRCALERLFRVPIFGYALEIGAVVARLPSILKRQRALEFTMVANDVRNQAALDALAKLLRSDIQSLLKATEAAFNSEAAAKAIMMRDLNELARLLDSSIAPLSNEVLRLGEGAARQTAREGIAAQRVAALANEVKRLGEWAALQAAREETAVQRAATLANEVKRLGKWVELRIAREEAAAREVADETAQQAARAEAAEREIDEFYASFENAFRGAPEEIKTRMAVYLPLLEEAGVGGPERPVVDLGCGRGEWLELLKERGLAGKGVDLSAIACARCRDLGLDVAQSDALAYLAALPDACLGAITAMHIVEHLPFAVLLELVKQGVRVLQQGGLLIFETPNPNNLLVATNNFYLDPTHRNPIPSAFLKFLMEARGLTRVEILELHPSLHQWSSIESEMDRYLVTNLFGGQDYAAIGRKPSAAPNANQAAPTP